MNWKSWLILFVIVLLAGFLRLWQLGQVPPSLDWDEASLGWNAYSLLKTGSDEYGQSFPLSIRSFNDYKPAMYVYATIPSEALFGLSEFAVRLPSALAGTLTVLVTFFLVSSLLSLGSGPSDKLSARFLAFLAAALLAVSPWHIQFSRVAFEANLQLFFFVIGSFFLVSFMNSKRWYSLLVMVLCYVFSAYSYHSARLVAPLFLLGIVTYYRDFFWQQRRVLILSGLFGIVLIFPLIWTTVKDNHLQARFSEVSIFSSAGLRDTAKTTVDVEQKLWSEDQSQKDVFGRFVNSKVTTYARLLAKNYLDHYNFDFLFLSADGNGRHHAPDVGLLYLFELPFLLLGIYLLISRRPAWFFIIFWWFAVAPLASVLTAETPHAIRSLLYLPTYQIIIAYGLVGAIRMSAQLSRSLRTLGAGIIFLAFFLDFFYFLHQYFIHLNLEYASSWQYGYKELVAKVQKDEGKYRQVLVTRYYDQPYIYFLFYGHADPSVKNPGNFNQGFGKYQFVDWGSVDPRQKDSLPENVLAVSTPFDYFHPNTVLGQILYPNQKVAFILSRK